MTSVVTISKFIPTGGITTSRKVRGGCNGSLYVHALAGAALYSAVSGVECGFPDGRSAFNMSCLDVNVTESNVGFSQYDGVGVTVFSVPAATSFRYICDITNWTNRSTIPTKAKAQVGLMATAHATFATLIGTGPQVAGQSAIYVEFAANTMKLVVGTTSSAFVAIPTDLTAFSIRIEYLAGIGAFLYLNNKKVATVNSTTATTALQLFARAGHLAAYDAATSSPIRFEVDAISVAYDKK
jgi:hypothetical protein